MDFFNKAYEQIAELFRSMTPAARITTGLLFAVIVISLVFLVRGHSASADAYLFGARVLTDSEISAMTGAFAKKGLNDWENEGNRIRVPRGHRHTYLAALAEGNAFPQDAGSAWREMFAAESPLHTRQTRELHAKLAMQQDLGYTIRALSGIADASVAISEIETDGFPRRTERQAVVTVTPNGSATLDPMRVRQIRNTVAYGAGVEPHNILVSDVNGGSHSGPPKDGTLESEHSLYTDRQREREAEIQAKIEGHFRDAYPGITVAVRAELDPKVSSTERKIVYDQKPTPISINERTMEETSSAIPSGGRPGAEPNGVGNRAVAVSSGTESQKTRNESSTVQKSIPGIAQSDTVTMGMQETYVTVSIGVPRGLFKKIWLQQNPAPAGEDPQEPSKSALETIKAEVFKNIEDAAVMLIPKAPAGESSFTGVKVTAFDDIPVAVPAAPGLSDTATSWFAGNWQTLALFALGCFGVYFLRGMVQSAQTAALEDAQTKRLAIERAADLAVDAEEDEDADELGDFGNSLRGRFQTSGRSLREELAELVRDDPDAAANVIQNWMREAA